MIDILKYKTDNSYELRKELSRLGYPCLSFSTNGKYIRLAHCQWANAHSSWIEKYSYASDDFSDIPNVELVYIENETLLNYILQSNEKVHT